MLDNSFQTGLECRVAEFPLTFDREGDVSGESSYLTFVLQPLFSVDIHVEGMMVQATDVTAFVIASREKET